jgi:hypothetical protein
LKEYVSRWTEPRVIAEARDAALGRLEVILNKDISKNSP